MVINIWPFDLFHHEGETGFVFYQQKHLSGESLLLSFLCGHVFVLSLPPSPEENGLNVKASTSCACILQKWWHYFVCLFFFFFLSFWSCISFVACKLIVMWCFSLKLQLLWQDRLWVWCALFCSYYSFRNTASCSAAAFFHKNVRCWVFLVWHKVQRKVGLLALGLLLWATDAVVQRGVLVSILLKAVGLWRGAQRHCEWSEPDPDTAPSLSSSYFPRTDMSHDPKPSVTFVIYCWNRIFHSPLSVPSSCF